MAESDSIEYRDLTPLGFPGYRVGIDGSVWCRWSRYHHERRLADRWRPMKLARQRGRSPGRSYLSVNLVPPEGGRYRTFRVHRLILEAFVGPCPPGMECRHRDGDPSNNALSNLCWATPAANRADIKRHGHGVEGARHPLAKLTEAQVRDIRARRAAGASLRELAQAFGVGMPNVSAIANRRSWTHLD